MAIYRGPGGAGDANSDITINLITELTQEAEGYKDAAASSATAAASSATAAAGSESLVESYKTAAETAKTAAETAQAGAETAETNAGTSATAAASSATSASTSATSASTSATSAATSATNAATSATNAATSETNAANSASAASTSATSSASSATAASTSASNASTSATAAASSATSAANSATASANSASAAATSATNAENAYDSFDDRYLGAKASAPSVDNDGDALLIGALYFDTAVNSMRVYSASGWTAAGSSVNGTSERKNYVVGTPSGSYDGSTTVFPATYDAGYVDVYLNGVKLVVGTDFTATNGTSITLSSAATSGDAVNIIGYGTFELANFSINDANDVSTGGVTDGQVLAYNNSTGDFEPIDLQAGATGGGTDELFWENDTTVTTNYTITSGKNAGSFGPITINSGVTVTVPSGSTWSII